jgi:hypothetical protein
VSRKNSRIFWKKAYYSRDREKDIIFDIAIESYLPGSEEPSLIIIVECKDYGERVPVGRVEEFESKISQLKDHNIKGIMVSSAPFDPGGVTLARNTGIGLARLNSKNTLKWVNFRKDRVVKEYDYPTVEKYLSSETTFKHFFAFDNSRSFESFSDYLIYLKIIDKYIPKRSDIRIPYKSNELIENKIAELISTRLYDNGKLNSDVLCQTVTDIYGVKFNFEENLDFDKKSKILGKLNFKPLEISISKELEIINLPRWRFTLAHEIGHLIFHYGILKNFLDENTDTEKSISFDDDIPGELNKNMEAQANIFASLILLPLEPLTEEVERYFIKEHITNRPFLYLDSQPVNLGLVHNLLYQLSLKSGASKQAIKYRLMKLGLIRDTWE